MGELLRRSANRLRHRMPAKPRRQPKRWPLMNLITALAVWRQRLRSDLNQLMPSVTRTLVFLRTTVHSGNRWATRPLA